MKKQKRDGLKLVQEAVERKRRIEGLSRRQAAARIGIGAATLTRLAQGQKPGPVTLPRIGRWLGWSPADMVGWSDEEIQPRALPATIPESENFITVARRHLRGSSELTPEAAYALMRIIETAYSWVRSTDEDRLQGRAREI